MTFMAQIHQMLLHLCKHLQTRSLVWCLIVWTDPQSQELQAETVQGTETNKDKIILEKVYLTKKGQNKNKKVQV